MPKAKTKKTKTFPRPAPRARAQAKSTTGRAAPGAPTAPPATGTTLLTLAQLRPSRLNPRRSFDPAALKELEDSIVAQGLIEPIVVRPATTPSPRRGPAKPSSGPGLAAATVYEVVAGERRFRAIKAAIAAKRLPADWKIGVVVRPLDDKAAVELALAENVQRESMHPLEEGEALSKLAKAGEKTEALARLMGKTQRWVQKRIRLAEQLAPKARAKFLKGGIALAAAVELSRAPLGLQDKVAGGLDAEDGEEEVRRRLTRDAMPVGRAIFKRETYTGALLTDEDGRPTHYADGPKAEALQRAAIKAKVAALGKEWAWVELAESWRDLAGFGRSKDKTKAGCIVKVNPYDLTVDVHTGLLKPTASKGKGGTATVNGKASAKKQPKPPLTAPHRAWAHAQKTIALQAAIAMNAGAAEAAVICALLCGPRDDATVNLASPRRWGFDGKFASSLDARILAELAPAFASRLLGRDGWTDDYLPFDDGAFLRWLMADDARRRRLFALLVARTVGSWAGQDPAFGDDRLALALADVTGAGISAWSIDADYLNRLNRAGLERVAKAAIPVINGAGAHKLPAKRAELVQWILDHPARRAGWVPPELAFGTSADILRALGAETGLVKAAEAEAKRDRDVSALKPVDPAKLAKSAASPLSVEAPPRRALARGAEIGRAKAEGAAGSTPDRAAT